MSQSNVVCITPAKVALLLFGASESTEVFGRGSRIKIHHLIRQKHVEPRSDSFLIVLARVDFYKPENRERCEVKKIYLHLFCNSKTSAPYSRLPQQILSLALSEASPVDTVVPATLYSNVQ